MKQVLLCVSVLLLAFSGIVLGGRCSGDTLPSAPSKPTAKYSGTSPSSFITKHWSEVSNYAKYRPSAPASTDSNQVNCPHSGTVGTDFVLWTSTDAWQGGSIPANGSSPTLAAGKKVLLTSCSFDSSVIFNLITIPETSTLIFDDAPITIQAHGFQVDGTLQAGSSTCRLRNKITITLWGKRSDQTYPAANHVKGIAVTGSIDIHGNQYFPTWTRLAATANIGDTTIFIQDVVNWQVGQTIVIATTELKDSRDWTHNEVKTITKVYLHPTESTVSVIEVDSALEYLHYGGREYQAEVSLLSRDILIQGDPKNSEPTDNTASCPDSDGTKSTYPCANHLTGFGGHVQVIGPNAQGRFSGIELYRMGQTNILARYPLHFHMMGVKDHSTASISDCSVHRSFYRCFVVHGTNSTLITQNTAYDAIANCFYMSENGVEENSTISYNFAAYVHPIGDPTGPSHSGWYGQYLSTYDETTDLLIPADMSAAGFYITNCYNNIFGNAASGGWTGFSFPALINPISDFKDRTNFNPSGRPFLTPFRGNTAHSSGFWWASAGAFYFGGQLAYTDSSKTTLAYNAGRSEVHDTCLDSTITNGCYGTNEAWLELEDNKAFLAHRGLQAWGNRADLIRFEMHDVSMSMNVFGSVWIDQLLMECQSSHRPTWFANCDIGGRAAYTSVPWGTCSVRDWYFFNNFHGFQWYDVSQQHILTNSIFRNCRNDTHYCPYTCDESVFQSLTHSDQYVPQNMQITKNITFDNCNNYRDYTTASTKNPINQTVSGRLQNWLDADGSVSGYGVRSQLGSARAREWWNYDGTCKIEYETYACAQATGDGQASLFFTWNAAKQAQVGGKYCSNGDTSISCPVVGKVTHFGRDESTGLLLGLDSRISGPVIKEAGGWFINLDDGTPKVVTFSAIMIDPNFNLVLALPYPSDTTFTIKYNAAWWCGTSWATCEYVFTKASDLKSVYNGIGNTYYFANNILYIRVTMQADTWAQNADFSFYNNPSTFTRNGLSLFSSATSNISITASCSTNPCSKPLYTVPAAINPGSNSVATSPSTTTTKASGSNSASTSMGSGTNTQSSATGTKSSGSSSSSSSGCFAASSSVRVLTADGRVVSKLLSELTVGESVESFDGEELVFSPVYYVAHAGDEKLVDIVSLKVQESNTVLKLTPHHLLLVATNLLAAPRLKPAGEVQIGEFLFLVSESGAMTRAKVSSSELGSEAVRNPLTLNNNIVVSGFACSAFAHSAAVYSALVQPLQQLYRLIPSAFQPGTLLTTVVDVLVVLSDWIESKSFAPLFVSSSNSMVL